MVKNKFAPLLSLFGSAYAPNKNTVDLIFLQRCQPNRPLFFHDTCGLLPCAHGGEKVYEMRCETKIHCGFSRLRRWSVRWQIAQRPPFGGCTGRFSITGSRHGPIHPLADRDIYKYLKSQLLSKIGPSQSSDSVTA